MLGIKGLEAEEQAIKLLLESAPMIAKIAQIRNEIRQRQDEDLNQRHQAGEIITVQRFGDPQEGYRTGEQPGRSSNDMTPTIRVIKVLKVEIEDNTEEERTQKFIMTMLTAVTISMIMQWLFGKCKRRNKAQSTPDPQLQQSQEEESEDFEIVSEPEDPIEAEAQEAEEVEAIQEAQQEVAEVQTQSQCEAIVQRDPPIPSTSQQREQGRKLYITQYGEKYHLKRTCQGLQSYRSYEKDAAPCCLESSQRILVFNRSQPTLQRETELSFGDTIFYHHKDCRQFYGNRRVRPICIYCEDEDRIMNYATGSQNT